jgi:uncharacterized protein YbaP (TraB family)
MKRVLLLGLGLILAGHLGLSQSAAAKGGAHAGAAGGMTVAKPALWKVSGVHGTVYLFGTIHVMKKNVDWETEKVKAALGASDVLYLEVAGLDDDALKAAQPMIMQLGTDADHPLSTKISKEDVALLDGAAKSLGAPGEQVFEPMKPWLAYISISVLPDIKAGYDQDSGVDKILEAKAKTINLPVKGLETTEGQIHFLADLDPALQVQMLHQALIDLPKAAAETETMFGDWERGDVDALAKLENDEMRVKYPELYKVLVVERNREFANTLAEQLKDPATGTEFVAVGAGHMAGPDSLVKLLEAQGFKAVRVE